MIVKRDWLRRKRPVGGARCLRLAIGTASPKYPQNRTTTAPAAVLLLSGREGASIFRAPRRRSRRWRRSSGPDFCIWRLYHSATRRYLRITRRDLRSPGRYLSIPRPNLHIMRPYPGISGPYLGELGPDLLTMRRQSSTMRQYPDTTRRSPGIVGQSPAGIGPYPHNRGPRSVKRGQRFPDQRRERRVRSASTLCCSISSRTAFRINSWS